MNICCVRHAEELYDEFKSEYNGRDSLMSHRVIELLSRFEDCGVLFNTFSEVKVVNLENFATAQIVPFRCPECSERGSLVNISAPLLLVIWRTAMIYMRCIKSWSHDQGKIRVELQSNLDEQRQEFQNMLGEYLTGQSSSMLTYQGEIDKIKDVPPMCSSLFLSLVDIAQISKDILAEIIPELMAIQIGSQNFCAQMKLLPRAEKSWKEELDADLIATLLIYLTEFKRINADVENIHAREEIGSHLSGGIALACEAMYHIVNSNFPFKSTNPSDLEHPPLEIRWKVISNYLSQIAQTNASVDFHYLAHIIGRISQMLTIYPN
jgi:hypothetical protein